MEKSFGSNNSANNNKSGNSGAVEKSKFANLRNG